LLQQQLDYERDSGMIADEAANIVRESIDAMARGEAQSSTALYQYLNDSLKGLGGFVRMEE
jgi:hypothetical protein